MVSAEAQMSHQSAEFAAEILSLFKAVDNTNTLEIFVENCKNSKEDDFDMLARIVLRNQNQDQNRAIATNLHLTPNTQSKAQSKSTSKEERHVDHILARSYPMKNSIGNNK